VISFFLQNTLVAWIKNVVFVDLV